MFFDNFAELGRIVVVGVLSYIALIFMLRVSGNRTLSKMNAFDFVVTVALGSVLATILLDNSVSLSEGMTAFFVLISLQFLVTWLSVRVPRVSHMVTSEPVLVFHDGHMLKQAMKRARVTEDEIEAAVRKHGSASLEGIKAIALESDGSFAVIEKTSEHPSALDNVGLPGADEAA